MRLPIDSLVPEILEHLRTGNNLVLEAPPGAGKTTRVPAGLLGLDGRDVLVLEPRRIAARLAARFVASERGEAVGSTVGYQVRFEEVAGPATRLRFLTEGVLTRRLLSDPHLERVGTVVLDEFHERHLEGDLALALLRRLQAGRRKDLRLVVMSATLDTGPVAEYLGGARVMRSEGRQYPLEIEYTPHSAAPLEEQVRAALERVAARVEKGHVLVFLPGAAEIRRAQTACGALAARQGWLLAPLHGDQSVEEQERDELNVFCRKHHLALIVDEVFLDYAHDGAPRSTFALNQETLTFTLSGLSKISGLPQMKLAWLAVSGPPGPVGTTLARLEIVADTYLSMNAPIQLAAPLLLDQRKSLQPLLLDRLRLNLSQLDRELARQKTCRRMHIEGGWYAVLRVPVTQSDEELAVELLRKGSLLVHPGHFYDFPTDGYLVVSLMTPSQPFHEGIARMLDLVNG